MDTIYRNICIATEKLFGRIYFVRFHNEWPPPNIYSYGFTIYFTLNLIVVATFLSFLFAVN